MIRVSPSCANSPSSTLPERKTLQQRRDRFPWRRLSIFPLPIFIRCAAPSFPCPTRPASSISPRHFILMALKSSTGERQVDCHQKAFTGTFRKSPASEIMDGRVKTLHPSVHGGLLQCAATLNTLTRGSPRHWRHRSGRRNPTIWKGPLQRAAASDTTVENIRHWWPSHDPRLDEGLYLCRNRCRSADYADVVAELSRKSEGSLPISFRKSSQPRRSHVLQHSAAIQTGLPKQSVKETPTYRSSCRQAALCHALW